MPSILARFREAADRLSTRELWSYALVPLVLAALNGTKITNLLRSDHDFHAGISFGVPLPVTDTWAFVSTPAGGGGVEFSGPATLLGIGLFAFGLLFQGILLAGYLGGLHQGLRGQQARFGDAIGAYWKRMLGFALLLLVLFLPPVLFTFAARAYGARSLAGLVLLWMIAFFALGYLLYAAPYLIVLHDAPPRRGALLERLAGERGRRLSAVRGRLRACHPRRLRPGDARRREHPDTGDPPRNRRPRPRGAGVRHRDAGVRR